MATTMTTVQRLAVDSFKNHGIVQELDQGLFRSWKCAKPGTNVMAFRVVMWPGCVYIGGDLQDFVFEREADMLPWLRGAIGDPHYMAGKVIAGIPWEFDEADLKRWLEDDIAESRRAGDEERAAEVDEVLDYEPFTIESVYSSGLFDEIPRCQKLTPGFEWAIEALRWFLANVPDGVR